MGTAAVSDNQNKARDLPRVSRDVVNIIRSDRWWLMLVGCDEMSLYQSDDIVGYQKTFLHSNHVVRSLRLQQYSVRCPI